jgi:hypothetical protein
MSPSRFRYGASFRRRSLLGGAWNAYDRNLKRLLEQRVPEDLRNQIAFGTFDVDPAEHWEICRQHAVLNLPFLAFYRDGTCLETLTGKGDERPS